MTLAVINQQTAVLIQLFLVATRLYTYDWFFQGGLISNNQNVSNLSAGTYNLTVTDNNNCYRDFNVTLVEPNEFLASGYLMMFPVIKKLMARLLPRLLEEQAPTPAF